MKKIIFLLAFAPFVVLGQKTKIEIEVKSSAQYCGGAQPSEEVMQDLTTPKPLADAVFIVVKDKKIIATVTSDKAGKLKFKLKKGDYKIYESWRYTLQTPNNMGADMFDKTCLVAEWEKVYADLRVEKKTFTYKENYPLVQICNWMVPCLNVEVPVPPSAPPPGRER
jgi:hypothetical protein